MNFCAKNCKIKLAWKILIVLQTFRIKISSHATYFPSGRISPEIRKIVLKPGVDFIQSQLSVWRFHDCLSNKWSVSVRRSDIIEPIKFPISHDFSLRVQDFWAWIESWRFDNFIIFANFQCDLGKSILKNKQLFFGLFYLIKYLLGHWNLHLSLNLHKLLLVPRK